MPIIPDECRHDKEYMSIIEDLLTCEKLKAMHKITHHYHSTRLRHSFYVSYVSYKIAKFRNLNAVETARAGLLHDFFLEDRDEIAGLEMGSHSAAHPKIAVKNASEITELTEREQDIILSHMFLSCTSSPVPRYKESLIVSMVDKYCAVNEFITPFTAYTGNLLAKLKLVRTN